MSVHYVQILNEDEGKAVRFRFDSQLNAAAFAADLNEAFQRSSVSGVVGHYRDDETCPFARTT